MASLNLLPDTTQLALQSLALDKASQQLVATAVTTAVEAACPLCHCLSSRVHSHYTRRLADLPCCGQSIRWLVEVRRFRCLTLDCPRKIFTERFSPCAPAYARRLLRQSRVLAAVAFALGGRAGARLLADLSMSISHDTLIRLIRREEPSGGKSVTVLGVDDWSYRRGKTYGTLLIDLETRRPIDLLPDRQGATLAAWLKQHPEVQVVSRDRGGEYALGSRQGAPQAVQTADRFHVIRNLAEALERGWHRHRQILSAIRVVNRSPVSGSLAIRYDRPDRLRRQHQAREKLVERYEAVQKLVKEGVSHREIACRLRMHRESVIRYARADHFPEKPKRPPRSGILAPYEGYLRARYLEGYHNELGLWKEIQGKGFTGSRMAVVRYILGLRQQEQQGVEFAKAGQTTALTPGHLVSLLLRRTEDLTEEEQQAIKQAVQCHEHIKRGATLFQQFLLMIRTRHGEELDDWLRSALHAGIPELRSFAVKLRQDQEAVQAGLVLSYNNGPVEGHVHRLKYLKRQMYGRASFDLLRLRVLHSP
jgi:transposase